MKDLLIVGAGGFGREVAWLVERINQEKAVWNIVGFIDDNRELWNLKLDHYPVLGGIELILDFPDAYFVCAIGKPQIRRMVVQRILEMRPNASFATLIDPSVKMSDTVQVGKGAIICADTIATVNIKIGRHAIINLDCTIGHDAVLKDYVTVYPSVNISGNVEVGEEVELGTGAQLLQGIAIHAQSVVGAGAVVICDVERKCTVAGVPAKPINDR